MGENVIRSHVYAFRKLVRTWAVLLLNFAAVICWISSLQNWNIEDTLPISLHELSAAQACSRGGYVGLSLPPIWFSDIILDHQQLVFSSVKQWFQYSFACWTRLFTHARSWVNLYRKCFDVTKIHSLAIQNKPSVQIWALLVQKFILSRVAKKKNQRFSTFKTTFLRNEPTKGLTWNLNAKTLKTSIIIFSKNFSSRSD